MLKSSDAIEEKEKKKFFVFFLTSTTTRTVIDPRSQNNGFGQEMLMPGMGCTTVYTHRKQTKKQSTNVRQLGKSFKLILLQFLDKLLSKATLCLQRCETQTCSESRFVLNLF